MTFIPQPDQALTADGVKDIPTASENFTFNHTMLRIKDPTKSLEFYTGVLGMTLLRHSQFPDAEFDLYFLAKLTADERDNLPAAGDLTAYVSRQRGILELTHNYGTENDANFSYHDSNSATPKVLGIFALLYPIWRRRWHGLIKTMSCSKNALRMVI